MANRNSRKTARGGKILLAVIIIILVIIIAALAVLYCLRPDIYHNYLGIGGHNWTEWETETEATCGTSGTSTRECTWCGEVEVRTDSATGNHTWTDWTVTEQNTCGADGYEIRTCTVCGQEQTQTLNATGQHSWGEWTVTLEATCGTDGSRTRTCSVCSAVQTETILATGNHTWGDWDITEATCGADGYEIRTCSVCGQTETEVIPATGEHVYGDDGVCIICGYNPNAAEAASLGHDLYEGDIADVSTADISFHFFDLGTKYTGDCILIKCGNTEVLIDAGARAACVSTIEAYIGQYCTDGVLDYVIATHGDQDHIEAFVGSKSGGSYNGLLYDDAFTIGTIIIPGQTTKTTTLYSNFMAGVERVEAEGTAVYTADQCYEETDGAKRQYYLNDAGTISMNILYNYYYFNKPSDENNCSVVTLFTEETDSGNRNFLFTGDLEEDGEEKMVEYYQNVPAAYRTEYNILPQGVDLYKAGHHGSKTSSTQALMDAVQPKNVAVYCCCGTTEYTVNNLNTFPTQAAIDHIAPYTDNIFIPTIATGLSDYDASTDKFASQSFGGYELLNGNMIFYMENGVFKLYCSNSYTKLKDTDWFQTYRTWNV
ncbi:MAG: MBL fold metallo-hydrolase [Clostridia bacterium]|nr:MBL fold metallo-hydrolase [Clostridia bacterium]